MADVQAAIRTTLLAHAGTLALIGTRAWFLLLPQNPTLPAVTVQQVSGTRHSAMGDDVGIAEGRMQVESWATTRTGVRALAEQVRDALQRFRGTVSGTVINAVFLDAEMDVYEPGVTFWRVHQDYRVFWSEA